MLTHPEIALLLSELEEWRGAAVQKVQQGAVDHVGLGLRRPGKSAWLHFYLQRGNLRFYLHPKKTAALPRAPAFTMALRKHLIGQRLLALHQPERERIAHLIFTRNEVQTTLVVELLPPGGNLVLLHQNGTILARLFNDRRNGTVGRPYQAPVPPPANATSDAGVRDWTGDSFHAFLAARDQEQAGSEPQPDDSRARKEAGRLHAKRTALLKRLDQDWEKAGDPDVWRQYGEWLASNPHIETRDQTHVTVTAPEGDPAVVPVNPRLSLSENVEAYFRKAKKATTARRFVTERRQMVESGRWEPVARRDARQPAKVAATPAGDPRAGLPAGHIFRFPGGSIIAVGRSAKENDRLTFGWARGSDYWTHARGIQGSHVLARHGADDLETILDAAARLALHYSGRRGEKAGDVQQTQRKHVQSMRGVPGLVRVTRDENRRVTLSEEELSELELLRVKR